MNLFSLINPQSQDDQRSQPLLSPSTHRRIPSLRRLRGGFLVVLGYLLSPLCWWNDLVFNLPIAYGFGYCCSLISQNWLLPGLLVGYWLSNLLGIVLMQLGVVDVAANPSQPRNPKKDLLVGMATSTVYTVAIWAVVQFKVVDITAVLPEDLANSLGSFLIAHGIN